MFKDCRPLRGLCHVYSTGSWGSASLHPRLYAGHPLRGLGAISKGGYQVREADESVKPRALALGICRNKLASPRSGRQRECFPCYRDGDNLRAALPILI